MCFGWWVVFSLFVFCAACLVLKGVTVITLYRRQCCAWDCDRTLQYNITYSLIRKFQVKKSLGSPKLTWADNIKMDLRGIRWGGMDWIDLAQDRDQCRALVYTVMNFRVT
jgi:hypothetical protein